MKQIVNKVYARLLSSLKRYIILMGGRGAGRSTVASQLVLAKLIAPEYFRCAIMRFILSDIRSSNFQEILDRAEEQGILDKLDVNHSQMTISYGANSIRAHAFRKSSGDQKAKLKSLANYNFVWVEEADEVPEEDFMQLDDSLRTLKSLIQLLFTFNPPPKNHWILKRWFTMQPSEEPGFYLPECTHEDVLYIRSSWKDNAQNVDANTKKRYEEYRKLKPSYYWNMIAGLVPEVARGKIYKGWKEIPEVPHEARLLCYGLDFGFDPDPAAIVAIYYHNGGYILDEKLYGTEYRNRNLATTLKNLPRAVVVADSAEPKSIAELKDYEVDVIPVEKGADSLRAGIQHVQDLKISYTARSTHLKAEYEDYQWKSNKDGEDQPIPDPKCKDHALDAVRYGLSIQHVETPEERDKQVAQAHVQERETVEAVNIDAGLA